MKIAVVGSGYVGLVLGACLAENGNTVACVYKDESKVDMLKAGRMPIYEPDREQTVFQNARSVNHGPLPDRDLQRIYERIMDIMRQIQQEEIAPQTKDPARDTEIESEIND